MSSKLDVSGGAEEEKRPLKPERENNDEISMQTKKGEYLVYKISDSPPLHITIVAGLQQGLMGLTLQLATSLLVADAVCAADDDILKARLLSSTFFMTGLTTVVMTLLGIRLPIFQGAAPAYVVPLLILGSVDTNFCTTGNPLQVAGEVNGSLTNLTEVTVEYRREIILLNIRSLQGSLMAAGIIQALFGFTGLIGFLLRFIGPLTIVPSMLLLGIYMVVPTIKYAEVNWGISMLTLVVSVILFLYLSKYDMPLPVWTPSGGCRVIKYPLHQVFSILISILFGWMLCGILTQTGVFTDDPTDKGYNARTDARTAVLKDSDWFHVPYPGQFGPMSFSVSAFVAFLIATFLAILDSIGDYYACARVCKVPPPPAHAVNRGIMVEGICSFLSGVIGCGHGTNSYGSNVGAIGATKVASRHVFVAAGLIYILFGVIGKFAAVFITLPYPVLGGALITMFAIYCGVILGNLQMSSLSSSRNLAILGLSIFIGLMIPTWLQQPSANIQTGSDSFDKFLKMILGNQNFVGTFVAFFLDNTVPGTAEERGIDAWTVSEESEYSDSLVNQDIYDEGYDVYLPLLPRSLLSRGIMKYIPFLPYRKTASNTCSNTSTHENQAV